MKTIRTTNVNVPSYWRNGQAARNGRGSFSTDGSTLYSYGQIIGITKGGEKILLEFTAKGERYISQTTSQHVGKARQYCDQTMHPEAAKHGGLI